MKVKELIDNLKCLDENLDVFVRDANDVDKLVTEVIISIRADESVVLKTYQD